MIRWKGWWSNVSAISAELMLQPAIIGLLGVTSSWRKAVKIGDTINVEITVKEKIETSKKERGIVKFERNAHNQNGDLVLNSEWTLLLKRKVEE